jgi:hypothetical protein
MNDEKRPTFWATAGDDPSCGPGHMGDTENFKRMIAEIVWGYVAELADGETITFEFGRADMTRADEEALPEI